MSAGTGVRHSEFNHSHREPLHFYQIWIEPEQRGLKPMYEQKAIPAEDRQGKLHLIASPTGGNGGGAVKLFQDAELFTAALGNGESVEYPLSPGRHAWVQVASGALDLNGHKLKAGDGAAISQEENLKLVGGEKGSEVLLFDLA
jgi:quercetin 2,3-dioxygenase